MEVTYNVFLKEKEITEEFSQKDMTWEGGVYTPSLQTNYYKVYLPFMVGGILSDVLYRADDYFMRFPNDKSMVEKLD